MTMTQQRKKEVKISLKEKKKERKNCMQFNNEVEEKKKDLNRLMRKEETETNLRTKGKEKK